MLVLVFVIFQLFIANSYNCIKLIPERTLITFQNEKYLSNFTANVRRISRKGDYGFNVGAFIKTSMGNNLTMTLSIYEYRSKYNQYIRSYMDLRYKWCDFVLHNKWFSPIVARFGITQCPSPAGYISVKNLTFNGYFPFDIKFDKGKIEGGWEVTSTGEKIGTLDVFIRISRISK